MIKLDAYKNVYQKTRNNFNRNGKSVILGFMIIVTHNIIRTAVLSLNCATFPRINIADGTRGCPLAGMKRSVPIFKILLKGETDNSNITIFKSVIFKA